MEHLPNKHEVLISNPSATKILARTIIIMSVIFKRFKHEKIPVTILACACANYDFSSFALLP
jgi:hypothetical protein